MKDKDVQAFMAKVKSAEAGHQLDLSSDEDLSIAIMNLVSIEEHLFFTGNKTGKTKYFDLLNEAREMRKELLKMIIKDYEGEVWCTSKHLLAASMRLFEVGTKAQTKGDKQKAYNFFKKSYDLYNLFWGINLGFIKKGELKSIKADKDEGAKTLPFLKDDKSVMGKLSGVIGKILDCCRE
jgi:hypothetical protein